MAKVSVTFCGKQYEIDLEEDFARFVQDHLRHAGVDFGIDNRPEALLKGYLRLAKAVHDSEIEIDAMLQTVDAMLRSVDE